MKACLSSAGSMMPLPSESKISKACLMSTTSSRGRVRVTNSSATKGLFDGVALPPFDWGFAWVVLGGGLVLPDAPFFIRYRQCQQDLIKLQFLSLNISYSLFHSLPSQPHTPKLLSLANLNSIKILKMSKPKKEKTSQQYRRDIFTLKTRIKQSEHYLEQAKQKCSQVDIFVEQSYSFQMKVKILQNDFEMVREKIQRYAKEEFAKFYELNFCVYGLSRACFVIGVKPEMVFRAVDVENRGTVKLTNLANFFRDVLRMDSRLFTSILYELDPTQTGLVQQKRYMKLLQCFMVETEKPEPSDKDQQNKGELLEAIDRVCIQMMRMECLPHTVWLTEFVNVATTAGALKKRLKNLDNLDCVAVYCRCDPNKQGAIESYKVIKTMENQMENLRKFDSKSLKKLKLKE